MGAEGLSYARVLQVGTTERRCVSACLLVRVSGGVRRRVFCLAQFSGAPRGS